MVPELQQYRVATETRVVVLGQLRGVEAVVGEYVVRSESEKAFSGPDTVIPDLVRVAMEKNTKAARTMAAAVVNTERSRLK